MMHYYFFFSSRRRHTRWPRDWSSDVCSSDLTMTMDAQTEDDDEIAWLEQYRGDVGAEPVTYVLSDVDNRDGRSEERRVGKECRTESRTRQSQRRLKTRAAKIR